MKAVALFNLGSSRAKKNAKKIRKFCEENNIEVYEINGVDAFNVVVKKAVSTKPDRLIIFGGDGTIIGAVGYAQLKRVECTFAVVPTGTANYLARNAGISLNIKRACKQALSKQTKQLYLALANDKPFALALKIGIVAETVDTTTAGLKRRIGQASYIVSALRSARLHDRFRYTVRLDNQELKGESHQILVVNSNLSDVIHLAPDATMHNHNLKLVIYKARNIFSLTYTVLAYILSFGRLKNLILEYEGQEFSIRTKRPRKVALDGDVRLETPVKVSSQKEPIRIAY